MQQNSELFNKILEEIGNKFDEVKEDIRELKEEFKEIKKELPNFSERINEVELDASTRLTVLETEKKSNGQTFRYLIGFVTSGLFATLFSYWILRR